MDSVRNEIRAFIVANFLFGRDDGSISDEQSFLESGVIDSTGLLELVAFVEQRYGITVDDRELVPENLDSLRNITAYVTRKQALVTA
jgi:acyl carrier protein